eukprot:8623697-Pyramimonas_sp.AAC.1
MRSAIAWASMALRSSILARRFRSRASPSSPCGNKPSSSSLRCISRGRECGESAGAASSRKDLSQNGGRRKNKRRRRMTSAKQRAIKD